MEREVKDVKLETFPGFYEVAVSNYIEFLKEVLSHYTTLKVDEDVAIYPAINRAFMHPTKRNMIIVDAGGFANITATKQGSQLGTVPYDFGQHYMLLTGSFTVHVISENELFATRLATLIFLLTEAHKRDLNKYGFTEIVPRSVGDTILITDATGAIESALFDAPVTIEYNLTLTYHLDLIKGAILKEIRLVIDGIQMIKVP